MVIRKCFFCWKSKKYGFKANDEINVFIHLLYSDNSPKFPFKWFKNIIILLSEVHFYIIYYLKILIFEVLFFCDLSKMISFREKY